MDHTQKQYSSTFYKYINSGSYISAKNIVPLLLKEFTISSVCDIGCGQGAWLKAWNEAGVYTLCGIDGNYVNTDDLLINKTEFIAKDLEKPFTLPQKYDLTYSLEVAEHISKNHSENFIKSICKTSNIVLFSAATPGQGGEFHINEQEIDYWRQLFYKFNFNCYDYIRPLISTNKAVEKWYKFNILLYIKDGVKIPNNIGKSIISKNSCIPDNSSISWKLRKSILRLLPQQICNVLAKLLHVLK